ncbi:MAG: zinc ribbon domain-containing protein [Cytophagaceae bacterium]|nr:MAG: zinc ribbon domain-containing protein [Cytophagaceae bacterium]
MSHADYHYPVVLYVYRCTVCDHADKLHLPESSSEVITACLACGAEVLAEWNGGVELATNQS